MTATKKAKKKLRTAVAKEVRAISSSRRFAWWSPGVREAEMAAEANAAAETEEALKELGVKLGVLYDAADEAEATPSSWPYWGEDDRSTAMLFHKSVLNSLANSAAQHAKLRADAESAWSSAPLQVVVGEQI